MMVAGRRILVTGASMGLGRAVAERCLAEGADVMLVARSEGPLDEARSALTAGAPAGRIVAARTGDVADADSVAAAVADADACLGGLDGVVHAAGVQGPIGRFDAVPLEDWVATVDVNLTGTLNVCRAAVPLLRRAARGKIVTVSGGGATSPRPRFSAYAASKAAVVRLTESIAVELEDEGIDVNAVAPGALNTRMLDEVLAAGPLQAGPEFEAAERRARAGGASVERAAELCAFLLSQRSDGISGRLLSAPWDPWEDLPRRRAELQASDVYTLRRILPDDRPDVDLRP